MGVVGRPVASFGGYNYSDAMKAFGTQGKVWDEVTLSEYLLSPRTLVSGTRMSFPGLRRPSDIVDLSPISKIPPPANERTAQPRLTCEKSPPASLVLTC